MTGCDVYAIWPELFNALAPRDRDSIRQVFASEYLDGWEPDRQNVLELASLVRGHINLDDYLRRTATTPMPASGDPGGSGDY